MEGQEIPPGLLYYIRSNSRTDTKLVLIGSAEAILGKRAQTINRIYKALGWRMFRLNITYKVMR